MTNVMHMLVARMATEAFPMTDIVTTLSLFRWLSGVVQLEYSHRPPYIVSASYRKLRTARSIEPLRFESDSFWTPSSTPLAC